MIKRIYLDHNASTPVDIRVLKAIVQELEEVGNPSSIHFHGQKCRQRLDQCRQKIACFLGVKPYEIIFTSGGTEGANLLLHGVLQGNYTGHLITSNVEHSCIYQTTKELEKRGCEVSFLDAGRWGAVRPEVVKEAIRSSTRCMTFMAANNETGVKTDIEAIAALAKEARIPLIVDGVALLGKEKIVIPAGVSAMFFSGHKLHAPKGIGFVFCRSSLKLSPFLLGGHQEFNRRSGTENLPGIMGLTTAITLLEQEQEAGLLHMGKMRDKLEQGLQARLKDVVVNGLGPRIANTSNLSFLGVDGETLLIKLDRAGISVSHGSACSAGALEPSRVLANMGLSADQARSAIRFSISRFTTEEEIAQAIETIVEVVNHLRK